MRLPLAATAVAGLFLVGACGSSSQEPQVRTVTETKTVYEKVLEDHTPQVCLDALDMAETVVREDVANYTKLTARFPQLVIDAANAGATIDADGLQGVTGELDNIAGEMSYIKSDLEAHIMQYNTLSDKCRGGQ